MKVLALSSFPVEAAATRFRLHQFVEPLQRREIELSLRPFLDSEQFRTLYQGGSRVKKLTGTATSLLKRVSGAAMSKDHDLLFVQREAMMFGPAVFERLYARLGKMPIILDLDDATWIPYVSPSYGRFGSFVKFPSKTNDLIDLAAVIICGNRFIAEYVAGRGGESVVIPTVVDTDVFRPTSAKNDVPVVGWIGTHSTFRVLETLFPVLSRLAAKHRFRLKIVGSGRSNVEIPGVAVENIPWCLAREVSDFQSIDIGLYPVTVTESMPADWIVGKSGFKAIQYMAVGVPFVMSPVGVCAELGEHGLTHLNAETEEEWYAALDMLLSDAGERSRMGVAGREHAIEHFRLEDQSEKLATVFRNAVQQGRS